MKIKARIASTLAVTIAALGLGVGVASVASAHQADITASAVCTDSGWTAKFTVTNDKNFGAAHLTGSDAQLNGAYAAGASKTATFSMAFTDASKSVPTSDLMKWSDFQHSTVGDHSVNKPADCNPPKPHTSANVVFHEGSVACDGTTVKYTQPSYTTSGAHVIFDAPPAEFGKTITVHASAESGYILDGQSSFTHSFDSQPNAPDCRNTVTPKSPSITQPVCTDGGLATTGSFTLPANADGIKYTSVGNLVSAHIAGDQTGNLKFAANLPDGWTRVSDTVAQFEVKYVSAGDCRTTVNVTSPTITQPVCTGPGTSSDGSFTLPANAGGVKYTQDGNTVYAHIAVVEQDHLKFVTQGNLPSGWTRVSDVEASFVVTYDKAGDCTVPTTHSDSANDAVCVTGENGGGSVGNGLIAVGEETGVSYTIDGNAVAPGSATPVGIGQHTVVATAAAGNTFGEAVSNDSTRTDTLTVGGPTQNACNTVIPLVQITVFTSQCTVDGNGLNNGGHTPASFVLPNAAHVTFTVNGVATQPGGYTYTAQTSILATADQGFAFDHSGKTTQSKILPVPSVPTCTIPVSVNASVTQAVCKSGTTTSGFLTLTGATGVAWKINGAAVAAGKHNEAKGTYTVTATSLMGYGIDGNANSTATWTLVVKANPLCATVTKIVQKVSSPPAGLAFTGGFGIVQYTLMGVVGLALGGLILAGLAMWARRRREPMHREALPLI